MQLELAKVGYGIINDDAITTMIGGGDYNLYDKDKKPIYKCLKYTGVRLLIGQGFNTVVDMPNMNEEKRKGFIRIGKCYNAKIIAYDWGPGNLENLERRLLNHRGYDNWRAAFNRKFTEYEEPSLDEGFDEIIEMGEVCK